MIYIITTILSIICIVFIGGRIFSANVTLLYETIDSTIAYNFNVGFLSGLIILGKLDIDTEGALCEKYSYATNPFCSTENPDGAAFCKHCGMPMSGLVDCTLAN